MYKLIACGGTFDLFHKGHREFLKGIFKQGERVVLGLTSDKYIGQFKQSNATESFDDRKRSLEDFFLQEGLIPRVSIVSIDDPIGPLSSEDFQPDAIAVTSDTAGAAEEINRKREEAGLVSLPILNIQMAQADDGGIISSTRIRNGEINREGRLYIKPAFRSEKLLLPSTLRETLSKPVGGILTEVPADLDGSKIITVGDITTQKFNQNHINQFLSIVDYLVERQKMFGTLAELGFDENIETLTVENAPGSLMPGLFDAISEAFREKQTGRKVILVEGEEDLAVLPVLLIAPLGYSIFYGQPGKGLICIDVTEETKEQAYEIVNKFT